MTERRHGIIFDAEGVVVDTEPVWDEAQARFLRRRGVTYDRNDVKHLLTGRSSLEATAVLKRFYDLDGDEAALDEERLELMRDVLALHVDFVEGFSEFFRSIRNRYATSLATAMDGELLGIVDDQLGLSSLFDQQVFTLEDVNFRSKRDLFRLAAERMDVAPEDAVVIEDSPFGIVAAQRAGIKAIGMATTHPAAQLEMADLVVTSYAELTSQWPPFCAGGGHRA